MPGKEAGAMLKDVLFDLDNTLVLYDEARFYEGYFRAISPLFSDLFSPEQFRERLGGPSIPELREVRSSRKPYPAPAGGTSGP
jgi:FMN phosphatase YigB (HAD superfamily)